MCRSGSRSRTATAELAGGVAVVEGKYAPFQA